MKKHEIADVLKQLDTIPLPNKQKILSACSQPTASGGAVPSTVYRRKLRFKPLIAACAALLLLISGTTYTIAAEVKEYKEAVIFFKEYDLSADGLSRGEIKKVYRDIKTRSFTYSKTAEVIEKSISQNAVGGYEIFQDDPTPEDLENLWNYYNGRYWVQNVVKGKNNVSYKYYSEEMHNDNLVSKFHEKSTFEKYVDNHLVWSAEFNDFWIEDFAVSDEKIIVFGKKYPSLQHSYAYMALIDNDGTILWETKLDNGFSNEYIGAILPVDEKFVVFSRGDLKYLCLSEYDLKGNALSFHKTEVGNYGIWNAAKLGDGYIVQLGSYINGEYARIVKVSSDGVIMDSFAYDSDDSYYYITDMIEYNDCIYLSAYSVPVLENEEKNAGGRYDIAAVLNYIFDNQMFDISNEELTKLVRDNFTAVLLVCNPASGIPQEFYSVKGSLGGKLAVSDSEKLLWDVESITNTFFSLATSAFTIGGESYVYRYTFDENGAILSQEKTSEIVRFMR
jgi:hypothetical protein